MFQSAGHRPTTAQQVQLSAEHSGKLLSVAHNNVNHTSILDGFDEGCGEATTLIYACPLPVSKSVSAGVLEFRLVLPVSCEFKRS